MFKTLNARLLAIGVLALPAIIYAFTTARDNFSGKTIITEETLPAVIGDWEGDSEPLSDTELNVLHSPAASQRIYQNIKTGDVAQVLLIQVENTQNAHDPRLCMAGSGYQETQSGEEAAPWADTHKGSKVSHSVFSKNGEDLHMYYWMSTKEGTVANMSVGLKMEGLMRALRGEPTRGIAIRVLGRPNTFNPTESPSPETLKALWEQIRNEVKLGSLVELQ